MRKMLAIVSIALGLAACGKDADINPNGPTAARAENREFVSRVEVIYHSYRDLTPTENSDWVSFHVVLANPDGTTRSCGLQVTAIRPYGSSCPDVGSTIDKIGPSTFRAYLYNVWVNQKPEDAKHTISAGEEVSPPLYGFQNWLETGTNISIAGAFDSEIKVAGACQNCVYGQYQEFLFRVRHQ